MMAPRDGIRVNLREEMVRCGSWRCPVARPRGSRAFGRRASSRPDAFIGRLSGVAKRMSLVEREAVEVVCEGDRAGVRVADPRLSLVLMP